MIQIILARLLAFSSLVSIIEDRIKPHKGQSLDNFPAIRYVIDEGQELLCQNGGIKDFSVTFSTVAHTYSECLTIANLIEERLDRFFEGNIVWCSQSSRMDDPQESDELEGLTFFHLEQTFTVKYQK